MAGVYDSCTCSAAGSSAPFAAEPALRDQSSVERQTSVDLLTPRLRTMVRPVRLGAPQIPDASLAEAVVTGQGDEVGRVLAAQGTLGRGAHRCTHFAPSYNLLPVPAIMSGGGRGLRV